MRRYPLTVEAIGDNLPHYRAPRVAVVRGLSLDNRLLFDRLSAAKHYAGANSVGSRGIVATYLLAEGPVYHRSHSTSWRSRSEGYLRVVDGEVRDMTDAEALDAASRPGYAEYVRKLLDEEPPQAVRPDRQLVPTPIGIDVLEAARQRIAWALDVCERAYVSFSAGKDSTVMLHLVAQEARRRGRKIGVLLVDLEAQYRATIDHADEMFRLYSDVIDPYWVALPLSLRNAVSMRQPQWVCWHPQLRESWVREPPARAITDAFELPFHSFGMEFEDFVDRFGAWYGQGKLTACFVGIRTAESLNRWRALTRGHSTLLGKQWTTRKTGQVYNIYPIYDWQTDDIWTFHARTDLPYNRIYDLMHRAGLTPHQMRICQPYGDDQRKGLWLYHVLEPQTWPKVVARVHGANGGALYAQSSGNMMGNGAVDLPEGHSWQSFAEMLIESLPPAIGEHYSIKIAHFRRWWQDRGYPQSIPDEADPKDEAAKKVPSWRRIVKVLLKNDYWCKGLTFSQHKSEAYEAYVKVMRNRRRQWGI